MSRCPLLVLVGLLSNPRPFGFGFDFLLLHRRQKNADGLLILLIIQAKVGKLFRHLVKHNCIIDIHSLFSINQTIVTQQEKMVCCKIAEQLACGQDGEIGRTDREEFAPWSTIMAGRGGELRRLGGHLAGGDDKEY